MVLNIKFHIRKEMYSMKNVLLLFIIPHLFSTFSRMYLYEQCKLYDVTINIIRLFSKIIQLENEVDTVYLFVCIIVKHFTNYTLA